MDSLSVDAPSSLERSSPRCLSAPAWSAGTFSCLQPLHLPLDLQLAYNAAAHLLFKLPKFPTALLFSVHFTGSLWQPSHLQFNPFTVRIRANETLFNVCVFENKCQNCHLLFLVCFPVMYLKTEVHNELHPNL